MKNDKQTSEKGSEIPKTAKDLLVPEKRFPKSAVDYIDALLRIQRQQFEKELTLLHHESSPQEQNFQALKSAINLPAAVDFYADADGFTGTGWSDLGHRRKGDAFRWMGRMASLLLSVDLEAGATVRIEGCGFSRRRYIRDLTVWLDDNPIRGKVRRIGLNRWVFAGSIPARNWRPYSILRLQTSGQSRLAIGVDAFVSLAVNRVVIDPVSTTRETIPSP